MFTSHSRPVKPSDIWTGVHITWKKWYKIKYKTVLPSSSFCHHIRTRSISKFGINLDRTNSAQIICIWRKCWAPPGTWCTPDAPVPCSTRSARPQTRCPRRGQPGSPSDGHTGPRETEGSEVTAWGQSLLPPQQGKSLFSALDKHSHLWTHGLGLHHFKHKRFCALINKDLLNGDTVCSHEFVLFLDCFLNR